MNDLQTIFNNFWGISISRCENESRKIPVFVFVLQITKATYLELFVFLCVMFQNSNRQHGFLCVYISTLLLMCIWWVQTNESRVWSSVLSLIHCLCTSQEHQSSHVSFFYTGTGAVKIRKIAFLRGGGVFRKIFIINL